jgi:hypothetical protein
LVDVDVPIDVDREDFGVQATDDLSVDPVELARSYSEQALKVLSTRALSRDDWGFIDYLLNQISYNRSTQIDRIRLVYQWADLDLPVEETFEYSIDGDEIGTIEPENLAEAVVARLLIGVYEQKQTLRSEGISLRAVLKGIQRFLEEGEEARNNPEDTVSPALEAFNRYSRELDLSIK